MDGATWTLHPDSALKVVDGLREDAAYQLFPRVAGLSPVKESSIKLKNHRQSESKSSIQFTNTS